MEKHFSDTQAYKLLEKRESAYLSQVNDAIQYAADMLPLINRVFGSYTIHGIKHAVNVVEYMYKLVEDAEQLSDLEIVVMIYAALFHDIGMIVSEEEIERIKQDEIILGNRKYSRVLEKYKKEQVALQECIRPVHSVRSRQFLEKLEEKNSKLFLIPGTTNTSFLAETALICQAHNEDFQWIIYNLRSDILKGHDVLNAQFLAVLLRIGDYLDIDEQRAPLYLYDFLEPKDYSNLEWCQHFGIDNFDKIFFNENTGMKEIIFQGQSADPSVHRKILKYLDNINDELKNAVNLCERFQNQKYLLNLKTHVVNKIASVGFTFSDYRLNLDYAAVTNLLMGEHIYGDERYGLREIVQNSIDACKTMQETAETHPDFQFQKYEPFITIAIDKDRHSVAILDNGSGMSTHILKKYFLNVGVSYYKSDDYVLQGKKYNPIGHYGIGFLACFMLSDKVQVKTRHIEETNVTKIEFERNSEYICLTYENKYRPQGTEIILEYDRFMEIFDDDEKQVIRFVESNFLDCGIPIRVIVQENGKADETVCNLRKLDNALPTAICLDEYLEGIRVYLECSHSKLDVAETLEDITGYEGYYYDPENNTLLSELDADYDLKTFIKDGQIEYFSVPIVEEEYEEEYVKAMDVLCSVDEALEHVEYYMCNVIPMKSCSCSVDFCEFDEDILFGDYTFKDFCERFSHPIGAAVVVSENVVDVISNDTCDLVLAYWRNRGFVWRPPHSFSEAVYMKGVKLSQMRLRIPYVADGIRLRQIIVNITNQKMFPNVSRDNLNNDMKEKLEYAIGKAVHLWIRDHMELSSEERILLEQFLSKCYSEDNYCLK